MGFGSNAYGQLGDLRIALLQFKFYHQVACGGWHTAFLKVDGSLSSGS